MFGFALTLHCQTLQVQRYGIIRDINKKKHGNFRVEFFIVSNLVDYE